MPRTQAERHNFRQDVYLEADRPLSYVELTASVLPKSISVYVNGRLLPRALWSFEARTRTVMVQTVLLAGDTVTVQGTKL